MILNYLKTSPWTANQKEAQKIFDYVVKKFWKKNAGKFEFSRKKNLYKEIVNLLRFIKKTK
ncbi:hypothetical protein CCAN12_470016 [Capnocytophaga canimorsus]|uniref:Uncharacterized protein n=1 Tax=Capnocytophaga canimorsus TaxID=28188 RepID=A0A0B7H2L5_9FLAO|nr:hypothetical protein CCAN12_470016 [Capnocytophaga canimorsus]